MESKGFALPQSVFAAILILVVGTLPALAGDVPTYHNDLSRTGQNLNETILTTSNVNSTGFGKLFTMSVDSTVDAQPLYISGLTIGGITRNVVYVVTENDSVYAFDADTGAQLWKVSVLLTGETAAATANLNCGQIAPTVGITSTPVIDRASGPDGTIYVVAMSQNAAGTTYYQRLHALDLITGLEEFSGPTTVEAQFPGTGENSRGGFVVFNPKQYAERAGLLLLNGVVYMGWSSHCDNQPYTGWLMGYNETTLAQTSVLNLTPNGAEGSIWQSGAAMASDGSNIFLLDANGTFDATLNAMGFPSLGDYGNAFVKISTSSGLAVADYFALFNTIQQSEKDQDLWFGRSAAAAAPGRYEGHHAQLGGGRGERRQHLCRRPDQHGEVQSEIRQDLPGNQERAGHRNVGHARLLQWKHLLRAGSRNHEAVHVLPGQSFSGGGVGDVGNV